jgi:hypothetical protein
MTEAEWETCKDPAEMYRFVGNQPKVIRRKSGRRKLRLFGVACCRKFGRLLSDSRSSAAIEVAERLADGLASQEEVAVAEKEAKEAFEVAWQSHLESTNGSRQHIVTPYDAALSAALLLNPQADNFGAAGLCRFPVETDAPDYRTYRKNGQWQADIIRCIFGNPFGLLPPLDTSLLTWKGNSIPRLAQQAYDDRLLPSGHLNADTLAVLADALEEAGCDNADILSHLRGPGPHTRGCYVIDWLLGKL